jgi:hypothetical protein
MMSKSPWHSWVFGSPWPSLIMLWIRCRESRTRLHEARACRAIYHIILGGLRKVLSAKLFKLPARLS